MMIILLAQAQQTAIENPWLLGGGGVTGVSLAALTIKHLTNRSIHLNGKRYAEKDVCDERHKNIDRNIQEIKETIVRIFNKLDGKN